MDTETFINELKNYTNKGIKVTHIPDNSAIFLNKKNTFKVDIYVHTPAATFYKRTKYGGYKETITHHNCDSILCAIEEYMNLPEVKTTEKKFNKNDLLQNIIAREIIKNIKPIDRKARIKRLATDDGDCCVITSWTFRVCRIFQDRVEFEWKMPCNTSAGKQLNYNMSTPSFDPNLLIKTTVDFAKRLKNLSQKINGAWGEVENNWYLETRNA